MKKYINSNLGEPPDGYYEILVESFDRIGNSAKGGHHSRIEIRPLDEQKFSKNLQVECNNKMRENYPIGTIFRIFVKPKQKENCRPHLYSPYQWGYQVVETPKDN